MKPQNNIKLESVKLSTAVVEKVRLNKIKTGVSIGKFFEMAAIEKLKNINQKKLT